VDREVVVKRPPKSATITAALAVTAAVAAATWTWAVGPGPGAGVLISAVLVLGGLAMAGWGRAAGSADRQERHQKDRAWSGEDS
jgi:hypothetical protein